ncbi:hypothetical protein CLOM_g10624 [Closterium sp. NIES-68]|nr:hypothetical protein CLOM_g10624 [Closterium sp. NIES-68]
MRARRLGGVRTVTTTTTTSTSVSNSTTYGGNTVVTTGGSTTSRGGSTTSGGSTSGGSITSGGSTTAGGSTSRGSTTSGGSTNLAESFLSCLDGECRPNRQVSHGYQRHGFDPVHTLPLLVHIAGVNKCPTIRNLRPRYLQQQQQNCS